MTVLVFNTCRHEFCNGKLIVVDAVLKCGECGHVICKDYRPEKFNRSAAYR